MEKATISGQPRARLVPEQSEQELSPLSLPENNLQSIYACSEEATICSLLIQIKIVLQDKPGMCKTQIN